MKPNKLENQIKEKLIAREIKPSANSWDRLDAMLSVAEEKKPKKRFGWMYVAASIVLFFGLGFFLFNADETPDITIQNQEVVHSNKVVDSVETNKTEQISVEKQPVLVQNQKNINKTIKIGNENTVSVEKPRNPQPKTRNLKPESQLPASITFKYISPEALLAEVQTGEKVISSEKKINSKPKIKVDAHSLLSTVEKELDDTHRETTLDKLTRKFQDAKSALVNRNYE